MEEVKSCQVSGCNRPARYALYRTMPDGRKVWLEVCREHEGEIGMENLARPRKKRRKK